MGNNLGFTQARGKRRGARPDRPADGRAARAVILFGDVRREPERGLLAADKFDIDLGQQLGVEKRAVLGAPAVVDPIARAERIERIRTGRMAPPGELQRIEHLLVADRRQAEALELHVDEAHVERRIVDDQRRIPDEIHEIVGEVGEEGLVGQKFLGQAVDVEGLRRHVALWIDVDVIGLARGNVVHQLDAADLHQPVAAARVKAGRFGIEHDLAHIEVLWVGAVRGAA